MASTADRVLALKLISDVSDIKRGTTEAGKQLTGLGKVTGKVTGHYKRLGSSLAGWGKAFTGALFIKGVETLTSSVTDGIQAFREEQQMVRNFTKTVKNMRIPVGRATKALDMMADKAVGLGFDDGDMIRGMDAFVQKTGDIGKATQMMGLAMDIARSKGIELSAAQKIVDQIYNGSTRALKLYGIEGVQGMEAIAKARQIERGKAQQWARNHPMEVLFGKIVDGWADVVGNLSQGNFTAALEAGQKLVDNIVRGVFGYTKKNGKKVAGLWDRLFDASEGKDGKAKGIVNRLGQEIGDAFGKVDWIPVLSEALNNAFKGLAGLIKSGAITQLAAVAGAIAGAIFAVDLVVSAFKFALGSPKMLISAIAAGAKLGGQMLIGLLGVVGAGTIAGVALGAAVIAGFVLVLGPEKFIGILTQPLTSALDSARQAFEGAGKLLGGDIVNGVTDILAGIGGTLLNLALAVFLIPLNLINETVKNIFGVDIVASLTGLVGTLLQSGLDLGGALFDGVVNALGGLAKKIIAIVKAAINGVIDEWNKHGNIAGGSFEIIPRWQGEVLGQKVGWEGINLKWDSFDMLPNVPRLAEGGITTGPTLAMIGEGRYQEAVVPLDGKTLGNTYNITMNIPPTADKATIGRELVSAIEAYEARGGSAWRR